MADYGKTGGWSSDEYYKKSSVKAASGLGTFDYSDAVSRGHGSKKVHDALNPHGKIRESRDSDFFPASTPVALLLDVTGSMSTVPRTIHAELPKLMGLLMRNSYVTDPQVAFAAVGDANSDYAPLQVGQFEVSNKIDDNLEKFWLEGGGGGTKQESYDLAMYFFSRKVKTDAWEKRKRKGYLFIVGDEKFYPTVKRAHVLSVIGDDIHQDIPTRDLIEELKEKWHVYYIIPNLSSYYNQDEMFNEWREALGQNVVKLQDPKAICEMVVSLIAENEGYSLEDIESDLKDIGSGKNEIALVRDHILSKSGSGDVAVPKPSRKIGVVPV